MNTEGKSQYSARSNFYQCRSSPNNKNCLFLGCNFMYNFNGVIYWSWNEKCPDIKCHFYLSPLPPLTSEFIHFLILIALQNCGSEGESFLLNVMQWLLANWLHFCSHTTMLTCNFRLLHNIKSTISVLVIFLALSRTLIYSL